MGQAIIFLLIVLVVVVGVHTYLYRRLVRNTTEPGRARRAGRWATLGLAALLPATLVGTRYLPHAASVVLAMIGYVWLALMFYLLVYLLVTEVVRLVGLLARHTRSARGRAPTPAQVPRVPALVAPSPAGGSDVTTESETHAPPPDDTAPDRSRRLVLARTLAIASGVAAASTVGFGLHTALGKPIVKRIPITLAKLPRRLDGTSIALVADIHLGPLAGRSHTRRIVDIINGLDADLVAVVGDLVDGTVGELGHAAEPLKDLQAKHGSFFVTGNHEYFSGFEPWIEEVTSFGLEPLRNANVEIDGLLLAGVNDRTGGQYGDAPDYDRALAGRDPSQPCILLAHQPVQAYEAAKRGVDLQLSGHTHGGQMVPFNLLVRIDQPIVSGLGSVDGTQVYVTNGAGFWGPPVRVGARPDITLVELRSGQ